jgi:hypothetical protein
MSELLNRRSSRKWVLDLKSQFVISSLSDQMRMGMMM